MYILHHEIEELKKIHKEETGEDLSDPEAQDMAERLSNLYELLAQQPPCLKALKKSGNG